MTRTPAVPPADAIAVTPALFPMPPVLVTAQRPTRAGSIRRWRRGNRH